VKKLRGEEKMLRKIIPALLAASIGATLSQGVISNNALILATSQKGSSITQKDVQSIKAFTELQSMVSSIAVGFGCGGLTFLVIDALFVLFKVKERSPQQKRIDQLEKTIDEMRTARLQSPSPLDEEELRVFASALPKT
jgi:hypothetical protein